MIPALIRPRIRLLLLCLVGQAVWLSCDGCELSTTFTDNEARRRELDEIEQKNWEYEAWHNTPVQRYYKQRFVGKIKYGVGCDVCPQFCDIWDLRPMEPEAFKQRLRATVQWEHAHYDDHVARELATNELHRLSCMAAAAAPRLTPALRELTSADEDIAVRFEAKRSLAVYKLLDPEEHRALSDALSDALDQHMLRELGREPLDAGTGDARASAESRALAGTRAGRTTR